MAVVPARSQLANFSTSPTRRSTLQSCQDNAFFWHGRHILPGRLTAHMRASHHTTPSTLDANVQSTAQTCLDHAQYRAAELHEAICASARGTLDIAEREVEHAMQSIRLDADNSLLRAASDIERELRTSGCMPDASCAKLRPLRRI